MTLPPPPPPDSGGDRFAGGAHHAQPSTPPEAGQAVLGSGQQVVLASAGARLGARLLDWLILGLLQLGALFAMVATLVAVFNGDTARDGWDVYTVVGALVVAALAAAYEVVFVAVKGQTPGKMIVKIRVVRAGSGGVPGAGKSALRWFVPVGVLFVPFVGWLFVPVVYLALLWDGNRQGWHDKAAGTLVVRAG